MIIESLATRTLNLAKEKNIKTVCMCGGVSANESIRCGLKEVLNKENIDFYYPDRIYCTDNAAMIASIGYFEYIKGTRHSLDLNACPSLEL